MATVDWSWPTAYAIDGTTYIKDTDNHITSATDDLVTWINSTGSYTTTGLSQSLVDITTAQTIAGVKTFSDTPVFSTGITTSGITIGATAITSTAEELNVMDGVTATTAEINILDGVTATASELNILDGVTATAEELNILDGVTATTAEINQLGGKTLESGRYTPTIIYEGNCNADVFYESHYIRVGNVVMVSGQVAVSATATDPTTVEVRLSLPYDLTTGRSWDLVGHGSYPDTYGKDVTVRIDADESTVNHSASLTFYAETTLQNSIRYSFSYYFE